MGTVYSAAEDIVSHTEHERITLLHSDSETRLRSRCAMWVCVAVAVFALVAGIIYGVVMFSTFPDTDTAEVFQDLFYDSHDLRESDRFTWAAVAADARQCSVIGKDMLLQGGSAVDAAIAAMLCVGVHNMQSTGIGGGHFMLIYESPRDGGPKEFVAIDGREVAPLAAYQDMYENDTNASSNGGKAVAVPGEVMGYYEAWKKFGKLSWESLVLPTVRMCQKGFRLGKPLADALSDREDMIRKNPTWRQRFIKDDGKLVQKWDWVRLPALAQTLRKIAALGADGFYQGQLADDIVADIQEAGGIITTRDLKEYKVVWREPTVTSLTQPELTVYSFPPPGSGPVLQYMLNIMDGYNLQPEDLESEDTTVLAYHRLIETFKFAYARRSFLADPKFQDMTELVRNLTSREYAKETRSRIDDDETHEWEYYEADFHVVPDHGTSHLSVVTAEGSAVALTSTINGRFGSKVLGKRTGIIFNNEMDDFAKPTDVSQWDIPPSKANFIVPGKRPTSSMCPTIVLNKDDRVRLVIGGAGGSQITSTVAYVSTHTLWLGMPVDEAMVAPRLHHQLLPPQLNHEPDFPKEILHGLKAKGHELKEDSSIAVVQAIDDTCEDEDSNKNNNKLRFQCLLASCDIRKGGAPDGY